MSSEGWDVAEFKMVTGILASSKRLRVGNLFLVIGCGALLIAISTMGYLNAGKYQHGRADALTAVRAQQQAATVALADAKQIREAAIVAVRLATDALRVCSGEEGP